MQDRSVAAIVQPRRQRLDAQRNRDRILAAAREAFTDGDASSVSMAEVARRAGVGVGTVYRHYPGRRHLLEAVFTDEVDAVCAQAAEVGGKSAAEALVAWLQQFFAFAYARNDVAIELISKIGLETAVFRNDRMRFCAAGLPLLEAAQHSGECGTRLDIGQILDVLVSIARLQGGIDHVQPMVDVFFDGLVLSRSGGRGE